MRLKKIGFRLILRIKLLPIFAIVVSANLGISPKTDHIRITLDEFKNNFKDYNQFVTI